MSFNHTAIKRLAAVAKVQRVSHDITELINSVVEQYLQTILKQLVKLAIFSGRKTIIVEDMQFLSTICRNYPKIIYIDNIEPKLYTMKKPFNRLVRKILSETSDITVRLNKNISRVLQYMVEQHIIQLIEQARLYMICSDRDTLLAKYIGLLTSL